jgi:aspartate/methionine/tyrosine aminotransferase
MFSNRLQWGTEANSLARLLAQKRAAGGRILDLTESNPTRAGIEYLAGLADARALRYEPSARGLFPAREAIAKYYADRGRAVSPEQILLTASTSEAYAYLFKLLADPGDEILAPRPSYPLFEYLAALESVVVRQYPLRYDGGWHVDFAELERAISARTRAIVVVNPNNPTGSFLSSDEWDRLQAIAFDRGLAVLSDEVFSDYAFGAVPARASNRALTFTMSGLSKMAGLPQLKLGWIVVDGADWETAINGLELIADTYLSVATPVQIALPDLLEASGAIREQIQRRTRANLADARTVFADSPINVLNLAGGWTVVLQVPRIRSDQAWATMLLGERDVLVQPGFFYDFESDGYLVVSLLTPPDVFSEGIRRII